MNNNFLFANANLKMYLHGIPTSVVILFTFSVVVMNILANLTVFQNGWLALDGGIFISWVSFLCIDIVTKAFGPRASTKLSVFVMFVNLFLCAVFYIAGLITKQSFPLFNLLIGGTWFILLSSSIAFISSAVINNYLNWNIGKKFEKNPDGKLAYVTSTYISTFVGQFFDNFIFAALAFMIFAPIFWNCAHRTLIQCTTCSLVGALLELLTEVIFSPIGYLILKNWKKSGIGTKYTEGVKI